MLAYENCAVHIFKAAKAIGAMCVLDAASVHHRFGSKNFEVRDTPHLAETIRRLDIEVANADLILTCSQIAADSYTAAGVPATKVRVFPLGASVQTRFPARLPHNNELHFLFAGVLSHRKSIDIILSVFSRLNDEGHKAHLTLAGGAGEDGWIERIGSVPNARYLCSMPQGQLHQLMAESDCLLLPSRVDSFGMVVAEAMACGTPAIVSTNTGASMLIRDFPGSGWIIEAREDALYQCILRLIENRQTLFNARLQAFKASERYSWNSYREEVGKLFSELVRK